MPIVRGPHNWDVEPGLRTEAGSLGEAIRAYEQEFHVAITPYKGDPSDQPQPDEPPRYFTYRDAEGYVLVDIHITRNEEEICPKQDLSFALLADDVVIMGMLVC